MKAKNIIIFVILLICFSLSSCTDKQTLSDSSKQKSILLNIEQELIKQKSILSNIDKELIKQKSILTNFDNELIKEKSISIGLSIYAGCKDYLHKNSTKEAYADLINTLNNSKGRILQSISFSSMYKRDNDTIITNTMILDDTSTIVYFFEMTFKKIKGTWLLSGFGVGA